MASQAAIHVADPDRPETPHPPEGAGDLDRVAAALAALMDALGFDRDDPHLRGTPRRVARATRELFAGLQDTAPMLRTFPNHSTHSEPVLVRGLPVHSICAHHLLPIIGTARVAYAPGRRLIGLSKFGRAVDYVARRPQIQERLTDQLADLLDDTLHPRGLLVVIAARHLCMEMRGIRAAGAVTTTSAVRGEFADPARRAEVARLLLPST